VSEALGAKMLQQQIRGQMNSKVLPLRTLSDRELEVLQLIGQWKSTRQIADELHLSVKTIEYYRGADQAEAEPEERLRIDPICDFLGGAGDSGHHGVISRGIPRAGPGAILGATLRLIPMDIFPMAANIW